MQKGKTKYDKTKKVIKVSSFHENAMQKGKTKYDKTKKVIN